MYKIFKLNNGLRVVVEDIGYVNSVSVGLWVKNGSRNESISENGISHFIEHMFFKGTENRSAFDIAECVEEVGGQINAFTGREATCFYVKVLDSHLRLALDVISDMIFNSRFSHDDMEREKSVVIEEINMEEDSPEEVLSDLHSKAIWGEDSISYPILGTRENVMSFDRKQLLDYIHRHYTPENSIISICGKFDLNSIEDIVEEYFGRWNNDGIENFTYSTPEFQNNHLFRKKNIEQIHLTLGIEGIENGNDDLYTLLLLSNILGGGASSILFQKIREEKSLCYSIYSYISSFNNVGAISIYTGLNPKYIYDAVSIINEEISKFVENGLGNKKLDKIKEQLKGNYILGMESTTSRMFNNGKSVLFLNKVSTPKEIMDKIDKIDECKLREVMDKTFGKGIKNSALVGESVDIDIVENLLDKCSNPFNFGNSAEV
ncbi:MAG: insulinase family protein [Clostridium sp.]|jgi:predicted Zn-dependent peptidase|uniref:M16 family metallopeptidase n=1 Tax=Clostridium sp. TaxID=1506 RepID=UPI0025C2E883|nr:pitrilysin family protein [Clostridium sp.]MCH3963975.1 insulinase family protein [Clostridium sp.]MCI1716176.1 insulinase family protein [Clostridium sp.]MCI1800584.1 insulinase family protein [Clostridium sp.]MCI1814353.1 insulinase family protein [Clostridium sp.]MCI1871252.1 insulinase family protein [Clostridium sp.]